VAARLADAGLRRFMPGYRLVHATVPSHAAAWERANQLARQALAGSPGPLWVVLGDSTAQGVGAPSFDLGYVGQVRAGLAERTGTDWQVVNLSRSGARALDVLTRQIPLLEELVRLAEPAGADQGGGPAPALVTCAVGANDLLRTRLAHLLATVLSLLAALPPGAVVATLPQGVAPAKAERVNRLIRAEAPAAGLRVADVWARTGRPWQGKFAADGFHPNAAGYADWAAAFLDVL